MKHGDACQAQDIVFQPVCVEVLGGWGEGRSTLKRLGQSLAKAAAGAQEEAEVVKHLFQRLSVLLMRGNSQLILSRSPSHSDPATSGTL